MSFARQGRRRRRADRTSMETWPTWHLIYVQIATVFTANRKDCCQRRSESVEIATMPTTHGKTLLVVTVLKKPGLTCIILIILNGRRLRGLNHKTRHWMTLRVSHMKETCSKFWGDEKTEHAWTDAHFLPGKCAKPQKPWSGAWKSLFDTSIWSLFWTCWNSPACKFIRLLIRVWGTLIIFNHESQCCLPLLM